MRNRSHSLLLAVSFATITVGGLTGAFAASLDVTSAKLTALAQHNTVAAPPVISCDNFARPPKVKGKQVVKDTVLDGRPVQLPEQCGSQTWVMSTGKWKITGGRAEATGASSTATLQAGRTDVSAEATFSGADKKNRVGGVTIAHSGGTSPSYLAAVLAGPGTVALRLSNGSTVTTIASAPATIGTSTRLRVTLMAGRVTISIAGTVLLGYTLTPPQLAIIAGNTRVGLYDDQGSVKFDDFLVTPAWAP